MSNYIKTKDVRTLGQKIRKYVFDIIYLKFGEYNEDKKKWEFKPLKIFRIKLHKATYKAGFGYDFINHQWCPYNFFKITKTISERYRIDFDHWVRTDYLEKYLWQKNFVLVRTEKYNEDELLEDAWVEHMNMMQGYGIL